MLAHVSYPALDGSGAPASLSPRIIGLLRDALGYDGLVATDALIMEAVTAAGRSESRAAVEAVIAGCDAVLYPGSVEETVAELEAALQEGALSAERVAGAVERVEKATASAHVLGECLIPVASWAQALELASASIRQLSGSPVTLTPGQRVALRVVDDDVITLPGFVGGPAAARPDRQRLAAALIERGVLLADDGEETHRDLIAVFSEVRAWKGRAGLGTETLNEVRRLVEGASNPVLILFGHPRLADQLPAGGTVYCAWTGDPLMQDAVAARLVGNAPA